MGVNDNDDMLEQGEAAEITVNIAKAIASNSGTQVTIDKQFTLELKPPGGAVLIIERTAPSHIDYVMNLN